MNYFENAGKKMGRIVNVAFTILLVVCGLAALAVLIAALSAGSFGDFLLVLLVGVLAVAVILGLGYLSMLQLAAFAELVENSNLILKEIKDEEEPKHIPVIRTEAQPRTHTVQAAQVGIQKAVTCPKCGKSQFEGRSKCFACGAPLKQPEE